MLFIDHLLCAKFPTNLAVHVIFLSTPNLLKIYAKVSKQNLGMKKIKKCDEKTL